MFQIKEAALRIKDRIVGTPLERALEESTSADNDNLNVPTRLLSEISDKSFNQEEFEVIMKFIWLQLMSPPEKWRKILKTLNLINYCLKNGSPRFVGDIREEIYQIRILHRFTFQEGGEDKGTPSNSKVREISQKLDQLLNDDQLLEQERRKADVVRDKLKSLQSFSSSSADNTGSKANRYEGFSSEDVGKFVKKTEDSSPESKESKGAESTPTKENENINGNDFVIRQNTKYNFDLTKDDVPEPKSEPKKEEPTTTQLLDLLDMSSPPVPEQKAPIENIPKQDTIWAWDQPTTYTKSEPRQNQDFDWDIAPQPTSGNDIALPVYNKSESQPTQDFDWGNAPQTASANDNVLGNLYNRSQSTPADVKASPFEWDQAPVAPQSQGSTPSAEEKSPEKEKEDFDMFQSATDNNGLGGKNFSESEKAIIDLSDMGKEVKETKTTEQGGFLYSNQQEIDDMFASITIQNNMLSNPQMNSYNSNMKPNMTAMYGYPQNNMGNNFGNAQMGFGGRI